MTDRAPASWTLLCKANEALRRKAEAQQLEIARISAARQALMTARQELRRQNELLRAGKEEYETRQSHARREILRLRHENVELTYYNQSLLVDCALFYHHQNSGAQ